MKSRIAVVGSGQIAALAIARLTAMGHNAALVSPEEAKNLNFEPEPIPFKRPYKMMEELNPYSDGKQFKCTGRHKYEKSNDGWYCECGRKL